MTYEANLDEEMHKPWPDICGCGLFIAPHKCNQGRGCPLNDPTTEPGPLSDLREPTPPIGAMTKSIFSGIGILLVFWFVWELGQGRWW